jgi:hypothetical protein
MRPLSWLPLLLIAASPLLAKPKVDVRVRINDRFTREKVQDVLPNEGSSIGNPDSISTAVVYYMNITVISDNAEAVAKNNGQWCVTGDMGLNLGAEYHGTLDGNNLEIEIPQKNGKNNRKIFEIIDHKWRTPSAH